MAAVGHLIAEHDVVSFREAIGKWPGGTTGAVVSDYGDVKLVEIADDRGVALDFVQAPEPQLKLKLIAKHSA
jgi:hypothetical protein